MSAATDFEMLWFRTADIKAPLEALSLEGFTENLTKPRRLRH